MSKIKYILALIFLNTTIVFAQRPREIQLADEPFDFTDPIKLIFVVIIPVLLIIVGGILIRNSNKKRKNGGK